VPKYYAALAHERFQPGDLLTQAGEAELAGFDGVCCSDHLAPWWTGETAPTASGNAWVWLGAAARETKRCDLGSAVTAIVHRYNPVVVPQTHVARIKAIAKLGAGVVVLMNVSGADPHAALRVYGE
jgi:coenzyme F420-dependent glucose-6-phosphate dehydrogenase